MKKTLTVILVLAMIMGLTLGTVSAADSVIYDNWQGVFGATDITIGDHYYGDAAGTVVANYVKGKGSFVVSVDLSGLQAEREYEIIFTKNEGSGWVPMTICWFTTDSEGNAKFAVQGWKMDEDFSGYLDPTSPDSHFNVFSYQAGRKYVLSTYPPRTDYPLEAVDSNRGE